MKFKGEIVKEAKVVSYFSQPRRAGLYFFSLMLISIVFNFIIIMLSQIGLIRYFTVTTAFAFVHFFLDGIIWKVSKVHNIVNV